jgi:hypothetical protein
MIVKKHEGEKLLSENVVIQNMNITSDRSYVLDKIALLSIVSKSYGILCLCCFQNNLIINDCFLFFSIKILSNSIPMFECGIRKINSYPNVILNNKMIDNRICR